MLKYPCLVLDHDDTVVQSEATVNYPYFCKLLHQLRPQATITLQEYTYGCYHQGFVEMCREKYQFTEEELKLEYEGWKEYVKYHIPLPFPGISELLRKQKENGGYVCVVSHSTSDTILRDYKAHFSVMPDAVYGWDMPESQRKPNTFPLTDIMTRFKLSPSQLFVVDDMKTGLTMARNACVPFGFAAWGRQEYPELINEMTALSDYRFQTVKELTDFLF